MAFTFAFGLFSPLKFWVGPSPSCQYVKIIGCPIHHTVVQSHAWFSISDPVLHITSRQIDHQKRLDCTVLAKVDAPGHRLFCITFCLLIRVLRMWKERKKQKHPSHEMDPKSVSFSLYSPLPFSLLYYII